MVPQGPSLGPPKPNLGRPILGVVAGARGTTKLRPAWRTSRPATAADILDLGMWGHEGHADHGAMPWHILDTLWIPFGYLLDTYSLTYWIHVMAQPIPLEHGIHRASLSRFVEWRWKSHGEQQAGIHTRACTNKKWHTMGVGADGESIAGYSWYVSFKKLFLFYITQDNSGPTEIAPTSKRKSGCELYKHQSW